MGAMHADELAIDGALVTRLLTAQFPRWAGSDVSSRLKILYRPDIISFDPDRGAVRTVVTVSGAWFDFIRQVRFGDRLVDWTRLSRYAFLFPVPLNANDSKIYIRTAGGWDRSEMRFEVSRT